VKKLLQHNKHVLLLGPAGSGKSTLMSSITNNPNHLAISINLNHQTTAQHVQKVIETKFAKLVIHLAIAFLKFYRATTFWGLL
jgi:ABC-type cobalamin/Fe3+-siderophores transport system ATPase subunit